ncbi:MAG: lipid-A-disaccharide synthase [Proteobacteria bacterium]|nr:lipid-A-disaccharide synthase [Pseudomonadota bacterium]
MQELRIGMVVGEVSGDQLGAGLIRALKARNPGVRVEGVAGPAMREAGCDVWEDADTLAVMGLVEPVKVLPRLLRLRRSLVKRWAEDPPDIFVGIDAPDFNLGLEKALRSRGITTVHFVSPTVWAWRQGRVRKVAKAVDLVLCIFPFEEDFYKAHDVAAEFIGHPLADSVDTDIDSAAMRRQLGLTAPRVIAVMPGSRRNEIARLGPVFAKACALLIDRYPDLQFVAPMVSPTLREAFKVQIDAAGMGDHIKLIDGNAVAAIVAADVVLLASGTASLQTALYGRPMVAAYKLSPLTYLMHRLFKLVKVKYFAMPNLLTDEPMVPEFLQDDATPEALSAAVAELLNDPERRAVIESRFVALRAELTRGAQQRAAKAILDLAGAA